MIAVVNSLLVKEGAADRIVERFTESRGQVQGLPGFVSMEVLRSEGGDEVLVVTRWRDQASFDAWMRSDECAKTHGRSGVAAGPPEGDRIRGCRRARSLRPD
jgi:heme-degrading monooxygenase HmoA